ncbi:GP2b protein [Southwest baboon virus 1]|uniref:GP2b protein n=1 Tax=Southwest baboon virus 1 TaxID=1546178 RepID=UPI0004F6F907|nr:GP2b protein [Southwest baboon virus 1]AIP91330.1 GP2b protein [Southwest baboon virus 1]
MLVFFITHYRLPSTSLLCLSWISLFTLCSLFSPSLSAKGSGSSSGHSFRAPLWLSLANLTSLRECLQTKQGFYEFGPIDDVINRAIPRVNYTFNGVHLQLTASCHRHHYALAERTLHTFFAHQLTCSSISLIPAQSIFFLDYEGRKALTLTQVAFSLTLATSFRSLYLRVTNW